MMASTIWVRGALLSLHGLVAGVQQRPEDQSWPARGSRRTLARSAVEHLDDHLVAGVEHGGQFRVGHQSGVVVDERHDRTEVELTLDDAAQGLDGWSAVGLGVFDRRVAECVDVKCECRAAGRNVRRSNGAGCCGPPPPRWRCRRATQSAALPSTDIAASRIARRVRERAPPSFDFDTDMVTNVAQSYQNGTIVSHIRRPSVWVVSRNRRIFDQKPHGRANRVLRTRRSVGGGAAVAAGRPLLRRRRRIRASRRGICGHEAQRRCGDWA